MYHGRDTGAWQLPEDELSAFIAKRTEMIRTGDSTPININLADGQVLRFICTALPDGGRMLSYTPVTDLVRYSDDPGSAGYYQACAAAIAASPTTSVPRNSGGSTALARTLIPSRPVCSNERTPSSASRRVPAKRNR
jgi:hypothetical protein